jgi:uncharacterized integral membrane protein
MKETRWWRWAGLALIGALAALFASFNSGERVALNLGFTIFYRVPLVPLIFLAFLVGMTTMFLLGLRHDLRVRRALREAGFGEPIAAEEAAPRWEDEDEEGPRHFAAERPRDYLAGAGGPEAQPVDDLPPEPPPSTERPPHYPP